MPDAQGPLEKKILAHAIDRLEVIFPPTEQAHIGVDQVDMENLMTQRNRLESFLQTAVTVEKRIDHRLVSSSATSASMACANSCLSPYFINVFRASPAGAFRSTTLPLIHCGVFLLIDFDPHHLAQAECSVCMSTTGLSRKC